MAHQSLYRRFRPRRFSELVGQDHVVAALRNAVRDDRVGHAYLFSGPRGTGKTSTARILAKALNCEHPLNGEPDGTCEPCLAIDAGTSLDLHELDAASNRGLDDIRELIHSTALGTGGRRKVYVLDEVHMLTTPASNALLKTLEEPPAHVVFVLATTDPQKVLPTIRSRTQHFEFHLVGADLLAEHAQTVIAAAGLDAPDGAVESAVERGSGSVRDMLSALEQIVAAGRVEERRIPVEELVAAIADADAARALAAVAAATSAGVEARELGESLARHLRDVFLVCVSAESSAVTAERRALLETHAQRLGAPATVRALEALGSVLVDARQASDPRLVLEIALLRLTAEVDQVADLGRRIDALEATAASPTPASGRSDPPPPPPAPPAAKRPSAAPRDAPVEAPDPPREPAAAQGAAGTPAPEAPRGEAPSSPAPAPPAPAAEGANGRAPDRDRLTLDWGDTLLDRLPKKARSLFGAGRFVDARGGQALFALPNGPHMARCGGVKKDVEAVLLAFYEQPIELVLMIDGDPPPPLDGVDADRGHVDRAPADTADDQPFDTEDLVDAPVASMEPLDRIREVFPGAELIEEDR
jgi:DNA polymerase III subunit gamma/tau